jgi:hypothetical protein
MSKSSFQKLYESAMGDDFDELGELGVDAGGDENSEFGDLGDELSDDLEVDEVTISLSKDLAKQLYDLLGAVVNVEDELGDDDLGDGLDDNPDGGDPFGGETSGAFGDEDEEGFGHALKGAKQPDMGKQNKVSNLKPQSGAANTGTAQPKVGNDGDHGHALKGAKQPDMGKQNKVGNLKPNKSLFEQ